MSETEPIRAAVYRAIDAVNDLLPAQQALAAHDNSVLVGGTATLDSMGFVNFIVALEEELERELHRGFDVPDLLAVQGRDGDAAFTVADLIKVLTERLG
jgi:acyl carrier protein